MWLRQHCVTATGPGVSLEARRWRGRSRILLLSKASLGASGTRPITSTSYCVCFTRHTVYLSFSLFHSFIARSHSLGPRSTPQRGIGQGDSRFLFAPIAPARLRTLSFSPLQISIWPIYRNMTRTLCTVRSSDRDRFDFLLFTGGRKLLDGGRAIPGKFRIEPPT